MIGAVLLDLDDTLYAQAEWLSGAWDAVCAAASHCTDVRALRAALSAVAAEGSARGMIIDRALARAGAVDVAVGPLVEAFRRYNAPSLTPYPGAVPALASLRAQVPVGLVTDGDPVIQRSKLRSLCFDAAFDVVVFSDELGRDRRKPHPAPFRLALDRLQVTPAQAIYIGDHPEKDVLGPLAAGIRAIRVLTGEYGGVPSLAAPWATAPDVVSAIELAADRLRDADAPNPRTPAHPV